MTAAELRAIRRRLDLSGDALAAALWMTAKNRDRTYRRWESGTPIPWHVAALLRLVDEGKLNLDDFTLLKPFGAPDIPGPAQLLLRLVALQHVSPYDLSG